MKNRRSHHTKTHISILGSTVTFLRHNDKYIFNQEIHVFESDLVLSSNPVLATERTERRDRFELKSVEFGRFMTPEGTERLILAVTSKTGQSV